MDPKTSQQTQEPSKVNLEAGFTPGFENQSFNPDNDFNKGDINNFEKEPSDDEDDSEDDKDHENQTQHITKDLEKTELLKQEGNSLFKRSMLDEAIKKYQSAVQHCPENPELLKVLYSNISIAFKKKKSHKNTINYCSLALEIDENFEKAISNRADAYYQTHEYEKALDDYKRLRELNSQHNNEARIEICEEKVKKEFEIKKDEMLGQLKGLGNTILGKFGMSLDNFKLDQQPGGGYNIRFEQ